MANGVPLDPRPDVQAIASNRLDTVKQNFMSSIIDNAKKPKPEWLRKAREQAIDACDTSTN